MKISIIIPVYNGEKYLEECLESVLNQDIEDKEIICVNDGSTDGTLDIIRKFQNQNECIRLIQQPNMGAGIARNKGIDLAKGKYIAFMDADDSYIDNSGLKKMVDACEYYKMPICGSLRSIKKEDRIELAYSYTYRDELRNKKILKLRFEDFQFDYYYQSYIYLKEFLDRNMLRFPNLRRYQDPIFFVKAMWIAEEFLALPVELYCYRVRTDRKYFSFEQINDTLKGIKYNIEFAYSHNLNILVNNSVMRLNTDFYNQFANTVKCGNLLALKFLIEIQEMIKENGTEICLLEKIRQELGNPLLYYKSYKFPFEHIPYGSDVVLYGAGVVGQSLYYLAKKTGYCNINKWVDQAYEKYRQQGFDVSAPDEIENTSASYIIIAVEKRELFLQIKQNVKSYGWEENKIIGPIESLLL